MEIYWSAKGGSGCTTVALGVALGAAADTEVLVVDFAGDVPHVLGCPTPALGVTDWLESDADPAALARLEIDPGLPAMSVLPFGSGSDSSGARLEELTDALLSDPRQVVIDAGLLTIEEVGLTASRRHLVESSGHDVLVTRPCYLALRRAAALSLQPSRVALVAEPGRSLSASDVERTLSAPVAAVVDVDPAVARAIDAGLVGSRLPRVFSRQVRRLR